MQCLKIKSLCVFGAKLWKSSVNLTFIPVFKPHTHKLYILRHCTNIFYIYCCTNVCLVKLFSGAVVAVMVWQLDLPLPMQSVPLTTEVVSLNPAQGVYSIQHYVIKFVSDLRQVCGFLWVLNFPPPLKRTATI